MNGIVLLLLVVWIAKAIYLDALPAAFEGADRLGNIVDEFFSAIVAGYVFYIAFSLTPTLSDRAIIEPYLRKQALQLYDSVDSIVQELARASQHEIATDTVTALQLTSAMENIRFEDPPNMVVGWPGRPATWLEYWSENISRGKRSTARLLQHASHMHVSLVARIVAIDDSIFFLIIPNMAAYPHRNEHLGNWASLLYPSIEHARGLKVAIEAQLPPID